MPANEVALRLNKKEVARQIERLDASADVKAMLNELLDLTAQVGGRIVDLGRRILAFILDLANTYPNITIGIVAALTLSYLVGSIPGVGPLLTPILTPLLLVAGIGLGALKDLTDDSMRRKLSSLEEHLRAKGVA